MGEKPLSTDEARPQPALLGGGPPPLDPMAAAGSINTTRSNIKNSAGSMTAGGAGGTGDGVESDPIPGIDVKLGKNPGSGNISGLPPDLKPTPTNPPSPLGGAGHTTAADNEAAEGGKPIPGVDIVVKKNPPH